MAEAIFPDTTVLCRFAAVHPLDLLEEFFRGRGRCVEAVAFEVGRSARHLSDLVADGDLTAPAAFDLMHAMVEEDRAPRLPSSVSDLQR